MSHRRQSLAGLTENVFDVLVIGGGIVGAGVARDAAMRGLKVALVDRRDFAFGTSSRSSRLLHGGLRYLAQGHIGLVREASVEKVTVQRIAPHLAQGLAFVFPTRRGTEWKRWKLGIGVKLYDLLCSGRNFGKSSVLSAESTLSALPVLDEVNLTGAVRYFDALTNDARLVLDTLRSARAHGAVLLNYTEFKSSQLAGDIWRCRLSTTGSETTLEASARSVINAAGAWAAGMEHGRVRLRLTKGVHLVIDRSRLPIPEAVVMTEGSRILFAIPWGERVILGTTDTDYDGPIDTPTCELADVQYILRITNQNFPSARLAEQDVISTWAGLRPLISDGDSETGKPSDVSRQHQIRMTAPGWFDVAGGKLTTYRLMAEQTIDQVAKHLGRFIGKSATATTPLLPNEPKPLFSGILPPDISREAVEHYCGNEWAMHLDDVMIRRTSWRYYHPDHLEVAERVATWMSEILEWTQAAREEELERYREMCTAQRTTVRERPGEALIA